MTSPGAEPAGQPSEKPWNDHQRLVRSERVLDVVNDDIAVTPAEVLHATGFRGVQAKENLSSAFRQRDDVELEAGDESQPADLRFSQSGCRDLNPGPSVPQTDALTKLRHSP